MLFFGYIVSEVKYKDLDDDIVKVVASLDECEKPLPKLIVGLENAKKYAISNGWQFDILSRLFPNGDMWTFKKVEKREFYEDDIETFKKRIVASQEDNVVYHYINIYKLRYSEIKRLYNIIFKDSGTSKNYFIIDKDMVYLAIDDYNVIGISLLHTKYIGIDTKKIISRLRSHLSNKIYFTSSKNMWKLKSWFDGREYVIASIFKRNARKHN